MFQSPSLRGSGRFLPPLTWGGAARRGVSIPFIAGQWSLRGGAARRGGVRGNVSIPFIAGQWSLLGAEVVESRVTIAFQSPSLRGSGRFSVLLCPPAVRRDRAGFNPLHCGAVVASSIWIGRGGPRPCRFNPLHCGAVVASRSARRRPRRGARVSIPFIAGQWSLHVGWGRAPGRGARHWGLPCRVSIPFIAGQWSLRISPPSRGWGAARFQSPSLRGSGRFGVAPPRHRVAGGSFNPLHCGAVVASRLSLAWGSRVSVFQSPSLRGSGRFNASPHPHVRVGGRFNPLHCGAVVASPPSREGGGRRRGGFQSPSLRGSGRFMAGGRGLGVASREFQSPSLRGSGRFPPPSAEGGWGSGRVSIPFIAGQWSLREASGSPPAT